MSMLIEDELDGQLLSAFFKTGVAGVNELLNHHKQTTKFTGAEMEIIPKEEQNKIFESIKEGLESSIKASKEQDTYMMYYNIVNKIKGVKYFHKSASYRDGGTTEFYLHTREDGDLYIIVDSRIGSKTKDAIYLNLNDEVYKGAYLVTENSGLYNMIVEILKSISHQYYDYSVYFKLKEFLRTREKSEIEKDLKEITQNMRHSEEYLTNSFLKKGISQEDINMLKDVMYAKCYNKLKNKEIM